MLFSTFILISYSSYWYGLACPFSVSKYEYFNICENFPGPTWTAEFLGLISKHLYLPFSLSRSIKPYHLHEWQKFLLFVPLNSHLGKHFFQHRPPAMEARFLECMAAIALHSNIPLPIDDENLNRCGSVDSGERGENGSDDRGKTANGTTKDTDSGDSKNSDSTEVKSTSPCRPESSEELTNSNGNERCFDKKWPNSAIDEELCQELENYKNSDVPVIHAFVLPPKLQHSGSSANLGEKSTDDATYTVASSSVAVPIPILNILLDRILQTMLDS